jgi:hypothetical protein
MKRLLNKKIVPIIVLTASLIVSGAFLLSTQNQRCLVYWGYSVEIYDFDSTSNENYANGDILINFEIGEVNHERFGDEMFNIDDATNGLQASVVLGPYPDIPLGVFGPGVYNTNTENVEANGMLENISGNNISWSLKIPSTPDKRFINGTVGVFSLHILNTDHGAKLWDENSLFLVNIIHPQSGIIPEPNYPQKIPIG